MKIKIDPGAYEPVRAHDVDAGLDLRAMNTAVEEGARYSIRVCTWNCLTVAQDFW